MITVTVIKSPKSDCTSCHEAQKIVEEVVSNYSDKVSFEVLFSNTPQAQSYGIITTPLVAVNKKIYSMGKPVLKEKVEKWIQKELG
ncbi:thioredoxin family protein [bacterium]|nr:thioredoxin family protein [bacterium]